jgi:hypothetical protein
VQSGVVKQITDDFRDLKRISSEQATQAQKLMAELGELSRIFKDLNTAAASRMDTSQQLVANIRETLGQASRRAVDVGAELVATRTTLAHLASTAIKDADPTEEREAAHVAKKDYFRHYANLAIAATKLRRRSSNAMAVVGQEAAAIAAVCDKQLSNALDAVTHGMESLHLQLRQSEGAELLADELARGRLAVLNADVESCKTADDILRDVEVKAKPPVNKFRVAADVVVGVSHRGQVARGRASPSVEDGKLRTTGLRRRPSRELGTVSERARSLLSPPQHRKAIATKMWLQGAIARDQNTSYPVPMLALREEVVAFLQIHDPSAVDDVDLILHQLRGQVHVLNACFIQKYGALLGELQMKPPHQLPSSPHAGSMAVPVSLDALQCALRMVDPAREPSAEFMLHSYCGNDTLLRADFLSKYGIALDDGRGVWEWSVEHGSESSSGLCQVTLRVPALALQYTSQWVSSVAAAEEDACDGLRFALPGPGIERQNAASASATDEPRSEELAPPLDADVQRLQRRIQHHLAQMGQKLTHGHVSREALVNYFRVHDPERPRAVADSMLRRYQGRPQELRQELIRRYGPPLEYGYDTWQWHIEYDSLRHPDLAEALRACYKVTICVPGLSVEVASSWVCSRDAAVIDARDRLACLLDDMVVPDGQLPFDLENLHVGWVATPTLPRLGLKRVKGVSRVSLEDTLLDREHRGLRTQCVAAPLQAMWERYLDSAAPKRGRLFFRPGELSLHGSCTPCPV